MREREEGLKKRGGLIIFVLLKRCLLEVGLNGGIMVISEKICVQCKKCASLSVISVYHVYHFAGVVSCNLYYLPGPVFAGLCILQLPTHIF